MTEILLWSVYFGIGLITGIMAGLFGIGGGLLVVPALIYLFTVQNFPPQIMMHLAVGTSLAIIMGTASSSVWAHQRHHAINWPVVKLLAPVLIIGCWLGVQLAHLLSTDIMMYIFAAFVWVIAIKMALTKNKQHKALLSKPLLCLFTGLNSVLAAVVGVGGGALLVPLLTYFAMSLRRAVATSAACAFIIATTGFVSNLVVDSVAEVNIAWVTGSIYWPAVISIIPGSMLSAPLGAKLAHMLEEHILQRLFIVFLMSIGSYIIYLAVSNS